MCVILVGKIGKEFHETAKRINSHGFSFFTAEQGLVKAPTEAQVNKAIKKFGIWHYRIASSGKIDKENIHPFPVAKGAALLYHNGVLGSGNAKYSDTNLLAKTLYNCSIETVKSVLGSLSSGQRFLLADSKDPTVFRLFGDWHVHQGVLMSNSNCIPGRTYVYSSIAEKAGWSRTSNLLTYRNDYDDDEDGETSWGSARGVVVEGD